jgi:transient receptor potential cation channel subfamily M protein 3
MSNIVVMLLISLLAFGLTRQSITYPNEEQWDWLLLRNVFYKPYFMLYGEVYADEIDTCGDDRWDEHLEKKVPVDELSPSSSSCVPGYWVPPLLMTIFLLIANILLISMLIAIFNNIFDQTNKISHQIWLFQRYRQVQEYQTASILPPPFTPLYHLHLVYKYIKFRYRMRRDQLHQISPPAPGADPRKWQRAERRRKQKVRLLREQLFDSTLSK